MRPFYPAAPTAPIRSGVLSAFELERERLASLRGYEVPRDFGATAPAMPTSEDIPKLCDEAASVMAWLGLEPRQLTNGAHDIIGIASDVTLTENGATQVRVVWLDFERRMLVYGGPRSELAGLEIPRKTIDQNNNLSARVRDAVALEIVGLRRWLTTSGTPVIPRWKSVDQHAPTRCVSMRCRPRASAIVRSWSENLLSTSVAAACSLRPTGAITSGVMASIMARNWSARAGS